MNAKLSKSCTNYNRQFSPQYSHVNPEALIQTVTAAKIVHEQQEAAKSTSLPFGFGVQRMHPEFLIRAVTESKIMQKRAVAKLAAEKKRAEMQVPREVAALDFTNLDENSVLKLADFMAALPESYEKEFKYGELIKPVPLPDHRGLYSKDNILIVGAQLEMAKFRAAAEELEIKKCT